MNDPILYVVLNGELNMSPGKAAAQAAHVAAMVESEEFVRTQRRTVIVLEAKSTHQLRHLAEYCDQADLFPVIYYDEGKNEVDAYSLTALAVNPIESDNEKAREIFAPFPLFGKPKKRFPWNR